MRNRFKEISGEAGNDGRELEALVSGDEETLGIRCRMEMRICVGIKS